MLDERPPEMDSNQILANLDALRESQNEEPRMRSQDVLANLDSLFPNRDLPPPDFLPPPPPPPGGESMTQTSRTPARQNVQQFVANFLRPYLTGQITAQTDDPSRKPMMQLLLEEIKKTNPAINEKELEAFAYQSFLIEGAKGLFMETPKTARQADGEIVKKPTQRISDQDFQTMMAIFVKKELPSMEKTDAQVKSDAAKILNMVKAEIDKIQEDVNAYKTRHAGRKKLDLHLILAGHISRDPKRQWQTRDADVKPYSVDDKMNLEEVVKIENSADRLINNVIERQDRQPLTPRTQVVDYIKTTPGFAELKQLLAANMIFENQVPIFQRIAQVMRLPLTAQDITELANFERPQIEPRARAQSRAFALPDALLLKKLETRDSIYSHEEVVQVCRYLIKALKDSQAKSEKDNLFRLYENFASDPGIRSLQGLAEAVKDYSEDVRAQTKLDTLYLAGELVEQLHQAVADAGGTPIRP